MSNGTDEKRLDVDPLDELSVSPEYVEQDLLTAQRAVVVHQGHPQRPSRHAGRTEVHGHVAFRRHAPARSRGISTEARKPCGSFGPQVSAAVLP